MADVAAPAAVLGTSRGPFSGHSLEIRDPAINIEEIMTRIRQNIAEKKRSRSYREDVLLAQGVNLLGLDESSKNIPDHLALLQYVARIDLEGEPISSHRTFMGFAIKLVKRLSRFCVRKYTDGLFARQNHFNAETLAVLTELNQKIAQLKAENEELRKKVESLLKR